MVIISLPACAGDNNCHLPLHRITSAPRSTDALIHETAARNLIRLVDIAQVDEYGLRHYGFQPLEVERAELFPFRDDNQGRGTLGAGIGIVAERDISDNAFGL